MLKLAIKTVSRARVLEAAPEPSMMEEGDLRLVRVDEVDSKLVERSRVGVLLQDIT
jgi:hypothetical protein